MDKIRIYIFPRASLFLYNSSRTNGKVSRLRCAHAQKLHISLQERYLDRRPVLARSLGTIRLNISYLWA